MSKEAITRTLGNFQRQKLIQLQGATLVIPKPGRARLPSFARDPRLEICEPHRH